MAQHGVRIFAVLGLSASGVLLVAPHASADIYIDPVTVSIGNGTQLPDGSYLNAQNIANTLALTSVHIQGTSSITIVDPIDLSTSTSGTPHFNLFLNSPTCNIDNSVNLAAGGGLFLTCGTLNLNAPITSGGTILNPSRSEGTATQVNVLSNAASIQQGIDESSTTVPATIQISPGQYAENLTIGQQVGSGTPVFTGQGLTLTGNDGTAAAGADPTAPTITGTQAGGDVITVSANGVDVDGLNLDGSVNGGSSTSSVDGVYASGVDGLTVDHNTLDGFSGPGIETPGSTNTTVDANVIGPTSITSASSYEFTEGNSPNFTVTAFGAPAPTFSDPGPLDGLTIDPVSGALSGTPTTTGTFDSTITTTNGYGSSATQDFALTVDPAICTAGSYSASGYAPCTLAPPGTYVDTTGATTATDCPVGTYNPNSGSTDSSACSSAAAGTYVDTPGSEAATPCGLGTYNPNTGSTSSSACVPASSGAYVGTTGATSATPCGLGTYQPDSGQSYCPDAPPGSYVDTTGANSATLCALGTYQPSAGQSSCLLADPGSYVATTGATAESACAVGAFSASAGATDCISLLRAPMWTRRGPMQPPIARWATTAPTRARSAARPPRRAPTWA